MYINSNLTAQEAVKLYGSNLPESFMFELADIADIARSINPSASIEEAQTCLVSEDCLQPIIKLLTNLHKNLNKSPTKEAIKYIIDQAEDLQLSLSRESEYAKENLDSALAELLKLEEV